MNSTFNIQQPLFTEKIHIIILRWWMDMEVNNGYLEERTCCLLFNVLVKEVLDHCMNRTLQKLCTRVVSEWSYVVQTSQFKFQWIFNWKQFIFWHAFWRGCFVLIENSTLLDIVHSSNPFYLQTKAEGMNMKIISRTL